MNSPAKVVQMKASAEPMPMTLPQNVEAEKSCLGAVLLSEVVLNAMLEVGLRAEHFTRTRHADVFRAMLDLREGGEPIDEVTVLAKADVDRETLEDLIASAPSPLTNARAHAAIVRQTGTRRIAMTGAFALQEAAGTHDGDVRAVLDTVVACLDAAEPQRGGFLSLPEFLAKERTAGEPYATRSRASFLGPGSFLMFAGPSNVGKTLAMLDFAGLCASEAGGECVGLHVIGGLRVGIVALEGTQEDMQDRLAALIPDDARSRVHLWDHWSDSKLDRSALSRWIRTHQIDVLFVDTITAFVQEMGDDTTHGASEAHFVDLVAPLRRSSGRQFAFVATAHSRKGDNSGKTKVVDQLEEIAGTISRKADSALMFRPDGEESARVKVYYAKARVGPKPDPIIVKLPDEESTDPPRFEFVAVAGGRPVKQGTEPERIAAFIKKQPRPVTVSVLVAGVEGLSESSLRRRRQNGELTKHGITHGPLPGQGQTHGYGTAEQWAAITASRLGGDRA